MYRRPTLTIVLAIHIFFQNVGCYTLTVTYLHRFVFGGYFSLASDAVVVDHEMFEP